MHPRSENIFGKRVSVWPLALGVLAFVVIAVSSIVMLLPAINGNNAEIHQLATELQEARSPH